MAIKVECECGAKLRAPDRHAGVKANCPRCRRPLAVPSPFAGVAVHPDDAPVVIVDPLARPEIDLREPVSVFVASPKRPPRLTAARMLRLLPWVVAACSIAVAALAMTGSRPKLAPEPPPDTMTPEARRIQNEFGVIDIFGEEVVGSQHNICVRLKEKLPRRRLIDFHALVRPGDVDKYDRTLVMFYLPPRRPDVEDEQWAAVNYIPEQRVWYNQVSLEDERILLRMVDKVPDDVLGCWLSKFGFLITLTVEDEESDEARMTRYWPNGDSLTKELTQVHSRQARDRRFAYPNGGGDEFEIDPDGSLCHYGSEGKLIDFAENLLPNRRDRAQP